jgi:hypothetical protein
MMTTFNETSPSDMATKAVSTFGDRSKAVFFPAGFKGPVGGRLDRAFDRLRSGYKDLEHFRGEVFLKTPGDNLDVLCASDTVNDVFYHSSVGLLFLVTESKSSLSTLESADNR